MFPSFSLLNFCTLQLLPQASISRYPNTPAPPFAAGSRAMWKACIYGVPFSCCNPHSPRPCLQSQLSDPHAHPLFDPRQPNLSLWSQGCHEVLLGHLQGLASTLEQLTLAVTFLLQVSQQKSRPPHRLQPRDPWNC